MSPSSSGRRGRSPNAPRRYPRLARVNETLREVLAEAIARLADTDDRLNLATVTAVECEADFRTATILMSSLTPEEATALGEARIKLQAIVSREVRLKRTPLLSFAADPAVAAGQRIEDILRDLSIKPAPATEPGDARAGGAGAGSAAAADAGAPAEPPAGAPPPTGPGA
jgi:ribosome-binding factor A